MYKTKALNLLRPNAQWVMHDDKLTWLDTNVTEPTEQEINEKIEEIKAEVAKNAYKGQRLAEYPTWNEQLDNIYHNGIDAWKADIKAIKDKYPKGDA